MNNPACPQRQAARKIGLSDPRKALKKKEKTYGP
jgi:hypothetical protein